MGGAFGSLDKEVEPLFVSEVFHLILSSSDDAVSVMNLMPHDMT